MNKPSEHSSTAYIGLGSNVGDREKNIEEAINLLEGTKEIKIRKVSSLYETEPRGYKEQNKFLNGALELETTLPPRQLLRVLQRIERELGRRRIIKWGPRTIDLDILLYGSLKIEERALKIPHPEMLRRDFVLTPLKEIAPHLDPCPKTCLPAGRSVPFRRAKRLAKS